MFEYNRKHAEKELSDTEEQLTEATAQNTALANNKRKLESDLQDLKVCFTLMFNKVGSFLCILQLEN